MAYFCLYYELVSCILHLLYSLKHIFVRSLHIVCSCISFSFIGLKYYFIHTNLFFSTTVDGNLSYFQFGAFISNVVINSFDTLVHNCSTARVYPRYYRQLELLHHIILAFQPYQTVFRSHCARLYSLQPSGRVSSLYVVQLTTFVLHRFLKIILALNPVWYIFGYWPANMLVKSLLLKAFSHFSFSVLINLNCISCIPTHMCMYRAVVYMYILCINKEV